MDRINYDVPEHLIHIVKMLVALEIPSFIPKKDKIVATYDTFLEKFRPSQRTDDGSFALDNCLNTNIFCSSSTHDFDIEVWCIK